MERLRTDAPTSRLIVLAFLDFINSVEPAPGVDLEGLHVAKECLQEVFKVDQSSSDVSVQPGKLVKLFQSADNQHEFKIDGTATTSANKSDDKSRDPQIAGVSKDELFGKYYAALDRINFFTTTPGGVEDQVQLAKATRFFRDAITEMEKSGNQNINPSSLAEAFKSQGNLAMQSNLYFDAVDLYSCATALSENNAIYYCNRAAAYTQIHKYTEAITDCRKSIQIDPNYSKAYSRLGLAYYAQGEYREALLGFLKALQLDPNNNSVRENIQVTQQKLMEQHQQHQQHQQTEGDQSASSGPSQEQNAQPNGQTNRGASFTSTSFNAIPPDFAQMFMNMASAAATSHGQEQNSQSAEPRSHGIPFTSIPMNSSIPPDFAHIFMNMASAASGQQAHNGTTTTENVEESHEPGIRVNLNLQEEVPVEVSGGTVVDMFSVHLGPQDNASRE